MKTQTDINRNKQTNKQTNKKLSMFCVLGKAGPLVHQAILFEDSTAEEDISWTVFSGPPVVNLLFTHTGIKSVMNKMLKVTPWNAAEITSTWLVSIVVLLMHSRASTSSDVATCTMVCSWYMLLSEPLWFDDGWCYGIRSLAGFFVFIGCSL